MISVSMQTLILPLNLSLLSSNLCIEFVTRNNDILSLNSTRDSYSQVVQQIQLLIIIATWRNKVTINESPESAHSTGVTK